MVRLAVVLSLLATLAAPAHAQPPSASPEPAPDVNPATPPGCIRVWGYITDGGHRWYIDTTNRCHQSVTCTFNLVLRKANNLTAPVGCTTTMTSRDHGQICGGTNDSYSGRWTRIISLKKGPCHF
jgi:hypothetical protein